MSSTVVVRAHRANDGKPVETKDTPRGKQSQQDRPEPEILFQQYFKSASARTYAAQVKRAGNGNHFLVLTDGRRDPKTDELRRSMIFVFSEDLPAFFRLLHETAQFIKANPVPEEVKRKRENHLAKQRREKEDARK